MTDLAEALALVLALVFAWAAVAKARAREATVTSFRGLRLPAPRLLAVAVPVVELVVAVGMVLVPALAAWPALALVLAFSLVIARAVASGSPVPCACFGGGAEDRPVSAVELVRNAGLGAMALVASGVGPGAVGWPGLPMLVSVTVVLALVRVAFAAVELRRLGGHVFATPLPGEGRR